MKIFSHCPSIYSCEQFIPVDVLAKSERFISEIQGLKELGYQKIGALKKISQVDASISVAKEHLSRLRNPTVGRVIYCSYWNEEIWTEFHGAKIHHSLNLDSDVAVVNLKVSGAACILTAFELAQSYIANNPERGVLVIAADKIDARFVRRKFSGGIFGDGAAATYLSAKPIEDRGVWFSEPPRTVVDGSFYKLDDYEQDQGRLVEASKGLQARLFDGISSVMGETFTFLSQPGARFSGIEDHLGFSSFTGDWTCRGYLPASGLLHTLTDFLSGGGQKGSVVLGEASVGLQYVCLIGSVVSNGKSQRSAEL
ncbi:hypothetical protein OAP63_00730 [Vibrio sp.]|nr:hypothetical protein [Vibrio sp.]